MDPWPAPRAVFELEGTKIDGGSWILLPDSLNTSAIKTSGTTAQLMQSEDTPPLHGKGMIIIYII